MGKRLPSSLHHTHNSMGWRVASACSFMVSMTSRPASHTVDAILIAARRLRVQVAARHDHRQNSHRSPRGAGNMIARSHRRAHCSRLPLPSATAGAGQRGRHPSRLGGCSRRSGVAPIAPMAMRRDHSRGAVDAQGRRRLQAALQALRGGDEGLHVRLGRQYKKSPNRMATPDRETYSGQR